MKFVTFIGLLSFTILFAILALIPIANAIKPEPTSNDLWNIDIPLMNSRDIYDYFVEEGLMHEDVSFEQFDYIAALTQQIVETTAERVRFPIAIAMIAVESNFDQNTNSSSGAKGLMQLMTIYHSKRMEVFVESDHVVCLDDFYNPRLNIACGVSYLDEILEKTDGDEAYALMWYNQGPTSASKDYLDDLKVSGYAKKILALADTIEGYLTKGDFKHVSSTSR